ncbi:L-serine ammonia-lyase [Methylocapsa acidiphila]|uniref:L-serine ammonia-lyase n=1 Tax=Methylocapsa acidiphila TaxID=133552 RepID=UPI00040B56F5|nr:L-serine ammonia-lyase [Methylocapsa acidiphila]
MLAAPMMDDAPARMRRAAAAVSVVDLFTIGIGPSSSHTVGPMRAAYRFAKTVQAMGLEPSLDGLRVELFGSLALTGKGHATDVAVILGLSGWEPEKVDPAEAQALVDEIRRCGALTFGAGKRIRFVEAQHLIYRIGEFLPAHPNALRIIGLAGERVLLSQQYYSVGGGAIVLDGEDLAAPEHCSNFRLRFPFSSAAELLAIGHENNLRIYEVMRANEQSWREDVETLAFVDRVRAAMLASIERGCAQGGVLPGGLKVRRRAKALHAELIRTEATVDPSRIFDWVSLYALAVNEENAAGGRVVTAPTNGAAGVLPAVLKYYETFCAGATLAGSRNLLLAAAAIGALYKKRASVSAAEMGCQGEVGVACSMAAAGLAAALGATNEQVENAAEIGMEHNLGLTCDPIGGLVQIPCIERNTMGAVKAINAARLALRGDGAHHVSLDAVIETMRQTGRDMQSKYKETSLGGLAVNVVEC